MSESVRTESPVLVSRSATALSPFGSLIPPHSVLGGAASSWKTRKSLTLLWNVLEGPGGKLAARTEPQLAEDVREMALHRSLRQHKRIGDFSIAQPTRNEAGHFSFSR